MTDNEIIKSLEKHIESTENIKYGVNKMTMIDAQFLIDILDLINRQRAEIEMLMDEKENLRCVIEDLSNNTEYAKSEAIKEFAERLKDRLLGWDSDPTDEEIEYAIDTIAKEMIEHER